MSYSLDQNVFVVSGVANGVCGDGQSWMMATHDVESDDPKPQFGSHQTEGLW